MSTSETNDLIVLFENKAKKNQQIQNHIQNIKTEYSKLNDATKIAVGLECLAEAETQKFTAMSALKALDKEIDRTDELTKDNIILKAENNEYKVKYGELDLEAKKRLDSQKKSMSAIVVSGERTNKLLQRLLEGGEELTKSRQQYGKQK